MKQDRRGPFDRALHDARVAAYPPGEYVGQESLMTASEILALASAAGIVRDTSVLDLCCGVAGPGRLITGELGCRYRGVDASASAVAIARERSVGLDCRFEVGHLPPLPSGPFDVVLLLETMLAFADKEPLVAQVSSRLPAGGRFAFTLEAGEPLTGRERRRMPDSDTVWPTPVAAMVRMLERAGLQVGWQVDCTESHRRVAASMADALEERGREICARIGRRALDDLVVAHRLWSDWLRAGRVRKLAVVAER